MISAENNKKTKRIYYLDILRVIACLSVIMIHASAEYVVKDIGSFNFWIGNILDSLSRIGVPLFVMISGALMLDKNYDFNNRKMIKHIKRLIIFFIFWSGIYCVISQIIEPVIFRNEALNIVQVIKAFIEGHYHLWFIYLIVGLYLIVPLLRLWVKDENKKQVEYFIILAIIFTCIIPQIISIGSNYFSIFETVNNIIERKLCLEYVGGFTTYFILGWYIHNYDIKNKKIIYVLGVFGLAITILGTYILSVTTGKAIQMYGHLTLNVLFQALMVFVFIKTRFSNSKGKENKLVASVSKNSLGIYAIHAIFVTDFSRMLIKRGLENAIINIPIVFLASFIGSFIVTYILSKIPILKRIV